MLYVRPAVESDLNDLLRIARLAGSGMTSLPPDADILAKKIARSLSGFNSQEFNQSDYFLLVLVDGEHNKVIGTAGIYSSTGSEQAFYAYRVTPANHYSHSLNREVRAQVLHLTNDYTDCSEIGTLFIDPEYRGNGNWLARSRYLLMSQFKDRFNSSLIAQIRGWQNHDGSSPFWNAIGQHFFEMDFEEADKLCAIGSNLFITELMPRYPIYTNLLPDSARNVIGKPHAAAVRAQQLLEEEGFEYEYLIDIFDGGPMLRARTSELKTIKDLQTTSLSAHMLGNQPTTMVLVANGLLSDFRATRAAAALDVNGELILSEEVQQHLNLNSGDPVNFVTLEVNT